ncbi:MAG: hypothetical protein WBC59_09775 [Phycisphaerae bacterium]
MNARFLAILPVWAPPAIAVGSGILIGLVLWLFARSRRRGGLLLRFLAALAGAWSVMCLAYWAQWPGVSFRQYLASGTLATAALGGVGALLYVAALITFQPGDRQWRRSSALLASVALMGAAFVRAAYQPSAAVLVQGPLAVLFIATVWRFRAEPLVYLAVLGVAVAAVLGLRQFAAAPAGFSAEGFGPLAGAATTEWTASTASGISLVMVLVAALLSLKRRQEFNVKWYRQGLLIVPLVVSTLAATAAGCAAAWWGATWHTVWGLGVWWAVLLVSAVGLKQPDLFGFSSVGAALAAVAAFAVLGGDQTEGYWGRYPSVLLAIALGAAALAALLATVWKRAATAGFARALYLASAAIAVAALFLEPFEMTPKYLGVDLLAAVGVVALAHAHRAPAWVNYLLATLATGGAVALARLGLDVSEAAQHHRFIQVAAGAAVGWLVVALVVRGVLRRTASDRTARRQTEPFAVFGMATTLALVGYLSIQQVRAYAEFLIDGTSPTQALLGPEWGFLGWLTVLLAFLLSMWLLRHTARTFLFYCVGIMSVAYIGLFAHTEDLYAYLIYAVAGYGAAHLVVYLYEARFMALLSRIISLYRDERRASTTIFTLAVVSCFIGAILAAFRLHTTPSLIMLGIMSVVFLAWSFVWLRGEMLYPAVVMVTLGILAIWHNKAHPIGWDPHRVNMNAAVLAFSALFWLGVGDRLQKIRGEIFQLAGPARACSVILALVGTGFAAALALSPTFTDDVWRQARDFGDWALGLSTLTALIGYYTLARLVLARRFYDIMGGLALLLLGLYVGIYVGVRL